MPQNRHPVEKPLLSGINKKISKMENQLLINK